MPCTNAKIDFTEGQRVIDILRKLQIKETDIEGVFVNGRIAPTDTVLNDGDRIAALPPGTPGPYRLLLGMVTKEKKGSGNAD